MIQNYITKVTENDIMKFALQNGISLSSSEVSILYHTLQKDYEVLLYGDSSALWNRLKEDIRPQNYDKIYDLFVFYKKKYQSYL